jgi:transaldolase
MKLFLDTANLQQIEDSIKTGVIRGVTTNPSLMAKEPKMDFITHVKKIVKLCESANSIPLSVEVFAEKPDDMYIQAREIYEELGYSNLNIKIPIGFEELKVIDKLTKENIPVNCTCCFTSTQLQSASAAGARYVSLFYNRLLDVEGNPIQVLQETNKFIKDNDLNCEIIAGSIRKPYDVSDAWAAGSHIVTAGYKIFTEMVKHPQTDKSVRGFLMDFKEWLS